MNIDFLPMNNGNYHEKQISYSPASSKQLSKQSIKELQEALISFFSEKRKTSLRDDSWDNNHRD